MGVFVSDFVSALAVRIGPRLAALAWRYGLLRADTKSDIKTPI